MLSCRFRRHDEDIHMYDDFYDGVVIDNILQVRNECVSAIVVTMGRLACTSDFSNGCLDRCYFASQESR